MRITTVGELIEVLKQFDPATPALKSSPDSISYVPIELIDQMLYPVRATTFPSDIKGDCVEYVDCIRMKKDFDAVIL